MKRIFEREEFAGFHDRNSGRVFQDLEFRKCYFIGASVSITRDPKRRSTARRINFIDCEARGCSLYAAIVEDVLVDGMETSDLFIAWGAVFQHVTLSGKLGRLMVSSLVDPLNPDSRRQRAFDEANSAYYATVDWALDIREAEFVDVDLRGVPARLVRRDPRSQVVVTREKALEGRWRQLDLSGTHWPVALQFLVDEKQDDLVLVAAKRARNYSRLLAGLQLLRDVGIAEPD